jgi:serine/threonine protein kinase
VLGFHRAGGMGEVFRARDRTTGAEVALKLMTRFDESAQKRFEREVGILAELRDPGIVEYVAHGDAPDGRRYLAMEWLDGEDLGERLVRAPLSVVDAVAMTLAVGRALAAAHARGIVHRDLKPQNVFLVGGAPSRAKLLDFGLARTDRAAPQITRTGFTVGTRGYMAPEQALGEKGVGPKADFFALGCVLYEAIIGRAPFSATEPDEVLRKIVFEDVEPLIDVKPNVPPKLSALVAAMLQKEASDRPDDASAIVGALEDIERERVTIGWVLSVLEGPDANKRLAAAELPLDIGKHPSATFVLSDRAASRFHCEIGVDRDRVVVRDLKSTNGLTLDGARIAEAEIRDGSILGIGSSFIQVSRSEMSRGAPPIERASTEDVHVLARVDAGAAVDLARSIHDASARRRGPFVVVDGGAYREADVIGASGGTALVRDVDRLSLADQAALGTLLESRTARVRGTSKMVDARIVATCASDLRIAVNDGRFRPDLFARLAGVRFSTAT